MRILIAHNRYRSGAPSGENDAVSAHAALLDAAGHHVALHQEDSDSISVTDPRKLIGAAIGPLYSPQGIRSFRESLIDFQPDVVHIHNVFPLLGPGVVRVAKTRGVPVVQTVHNYRHGCINGLHVRDGMRCDACLGRGLPWPGAVHGCYRGSRLQSFAMAAGHAVHRQSWSLVDRFMALTPFMAARLSLAGVPSCKIVTSPNWTTDPGPPPRPGRDVLFVGRLDEAKGVHLLLDAWQRASASPRRLLIAGDGPLRSLVEARASNDARIRVLGLISKRDVLRQMWACAVVAVPSVVYEGFPLTIAEAFAAGRAVLTTSGGSAASIVDDRVGWISALDAGTLAGTLLSITDEEVRGRGRAARELFLAQLTPEQALKRHLQVYRSLIRQGGK